MAGFRKYVVTAFYCEVCKEWHYHHEAQFHECIDKYNAHHGFKGSTIKD